MGLTTVCRDPAVARLLVGAGAHVVLCGDDAAGLADAIVAVRAGAGSGGRVGALVGDATDPAVEAAALAMAGELFGGEPVVVRSLSEANRLLAQPPGSKRGGSGSV